MHSSPDLSVCVLALAEVPPQSCALSTDEPEHLSLYLKKARATFTATLYLSLGATALATEKVYAGHDVLSHRVICQHGVLSHLSAVRLFRRAERAEQARTVVACLEERALCDSLAA